MRIILNVSLTPELQQIIDNTVSTGHYSNKSEFIRHLIRSWHHQHTHTLLYYISTIQKKIKKTPTFILRQLRLVFQILTHPFTHPQKTITNIAFFLYLRTSTLRKISLTTIKLCQKLIKPATRYLHLCQKNITNFSNDISIRFDHKIKHYQYMKNHSKEFLETQ